MTWLRTLTLALVLGVAVAATAVACPSRRTADRRAVRHVAQRYLDALARGDERTACLVLSRRGRADAGARTLKQCERIYRQGGRFPHFHVVAVTLHGRDASAVVDDAPISDSGNDFLELHRHGRRWLIDAG